MQQHENTLTNTVATPLTTSLASPKASSVASDVIKDEFPVWLRNFVVIYQQLDTDNLELLKEIYHAEITFIDPLHQVSGFDNLHQYFTGLYQNLSACTFKINEVFTQGQQAAIYWQMQYQHKQLNQGRMVTVTGHSHIKANEDKVIYHRDYLDAGAMLYEQLPVIGRVIQWVKRRASR